MIRICKFYCVPPNVELTVAQLCPLIMVWSISLQKLARRPYYLHGVHLLGRIFHAAAVHPAPQAAGHTRLPRWSGVANQHVNVMTGHDANLQSCCHISVSHRHSSQRALTAEQQLTRNTTLCGLYTSASLLTMVSPLQTCM